MQSIEVSTGQDERVVEAILDLLYRRVGTDFARYRPDLIRRRIRNRMISAGAATLDAYLALLAGSDEETARLVERVTIKVSRFYRNAAAFDRLRTAILPQLAERRQGAPLRIWSAGCASGEEAYSLAMLLDAASLPGTVHATDLDGSALDVARRGLYPEASLRELPEAFRRRYLVPQADGIWSVDDLLRSRVRFGRHDLTSLQDPPGATRFDLVSCRNVLIYLQRDLQEQVFDRLQGALADGGCLFLGEAESLPPRLAEHFDTGARSHRLFLLHECADA